MNPLYRSRLWLAFLFLIGANAWSAAPVFNILDYGARNDGSTPATEAFRSAIQAAKAVGGGTVCVPAGKYVSGPIELVSNLELHFDQGATVRFPAMRLPYTKGRQQGIECLTPVPLIGGRNLENVSITGRGVLMTDQPEWLDLMGRPKKATATDPGTEFGAAWTHLLELLELKRPVSEEEYLKVAPSLRPSFLRTMDSRNILIEGLHFVGSPMWTIHLLYSERAVVRDVIIETYPGAETDGIVVDSSRDVHISNCYLETGDDALVLKAGKDADGLRVNRPVEDVTIANCIFHRAHGAVTLGSETSGGIRNVVASNIVCRGTQIGIRLKSRRGRGGVVEGIRFDQWAMEDVGQAINVTNYYLMAGEVRTSEQPVTERTPVFRNVAISHATINRARVAINIEGLPEMPVAGLRISDVIASAKTGMKAEHTTGLELHNVQVNAEGGSAFQVRDSKELELDAVSTRNPLAKAPVIRLDRCPGAIVRGSRAFRGTGTFLSAGPGELKGVVLEGNALASARKATEEAPDSGYTPEPPTERN